MINWSIVGQFLRGERDDVVKLNVVSFGYVPEHGKSLYRLKCPFCKNTVKAYVWSLSAVGKKCECGSLFDKNGNCFKLKEN